MKKTLLKILIALGLIIITPWSIYRINEIYYINFVNEYLPLSKKEAVEKLCKDKRIEYLTLFLRYKSKSEEEHHIKQINECEIPNRAWTRKLDEDTSNDKFIVVLYPKIPFLSYRASVNFYYKNDIIYKYETHAGLEFI